MKKRSLLFRCHGATAEATARDACEFIKGYFDLWNQRPKVYFSPMERDITELTTPLPYDVFIETAKPENVSIAHAAGWSYLVGKEQHAKELEVIERASIPPINDDT